MRSVGRTRDDTARPAISSIGLGTGVDPRGRLAAGAEAPNDNPTQFDFTGRALPSIRAHRRP